MSLFAYEPNNLYPRSWYTYEEVSKMLRNKKENNMENIFVCIGDDKYRPRTITSTISTGGAAEFDIETAVSSYFKCDPYEPVKVIFNDPATIVFWGDGTKTVVKCTNEDFDPEKGLAMAIAKKALGNKRDYYEVFKKWVPEVEEENKSNDEDVKYDGYMRKCLYCGKYFNACKEIHTCDEMMDYMVKSILGI